MGTLCSPYGNDGGGGACTHTHTHTHTQNIGNYSQRFAYIHTRAVHT